MDLKIKKLNSEAKLPTKHHESDAGLDFYCVEEVVVKSGEQAVVKTGVSIEVPFGYTGLIWDKSGISIKHGIKTLGGVIDSGYRGEILIGVINHSKEDYIFEKGNKIAQMLIQKIEDVNIKEVEELSVADRGEKGFGSTGK